MFYVVEMSYNESAEYANGGMTANFNVPEALQRFEFFAEGGMDEAVRIAYGYLQGLTEQAKDELDYSDYTESYVHFTLENYANKLGISYEITRKQLKPYYFVCHLPQDIQNLIVYRLKENGITDPEDIDDALNSRLSSLDDAIDITDILCGETINKCTFCGKLDFVDTLQVKGYTVLTSCDCVDKI